ncbi:ATP-binding cassette domain-containing protein [Uliginosibacterium sp. H1]|uniref:ATP-binding cassette domain-containing protein n=1 Tax=Uliginosibacterium sp. H1 TaxID=3114757 RepID=UPI002E1730E6|nr:ATP-binding cassette domain-containing protein [Uliginosibacterium sp. H1]
MNAPQPFLQASPPVQAAARPGAAWPAVLEHLRLHFSLPAPARASAPRPAAGDAGLVQYAERLGLKLQRIQLHPDINLLPCVVERDGRLGIVEAVEARGAVAEGEFRLRWFGDGVQAARVPFAELDGDAWLVTPMSQVDARSTGLLPEQPQHWLRRALDQARPWYRDLLLASFVVNLLAMLVPLFTMNVYDRVVPNQAIDTLWVMAAGIVIVMVFDWLLRDARTRITDMAGRQIDVDISSALYGRLLGMKLAQRPQSTGAFAKQLQDVDSIRDFLTSATLVALVDLPFAALFMVLIVWLAGPLVVIPLVALAVLLLAAWRAHLRLARAMEEASRLSSQRQAQLIETLLMLPEYKQQNREAQQGERWRRLVSAMADHGVHQRHVSTDLSHLMNFAQYAVTVALLIAGVYRMSEGLLTMGAMIAIVMLSGRAAQSMNQLAMLLLRWSQTRSAITTLDGIMALEQENQAHAFSEMRFRGGIHLQDARFAYPGQQRPALDALSLTLAPGERVAVLGASGSGKSTLLCLLAAQFDLQQGRLLYDGVERERWPLSQLREALGWLPQQPQLCWGTVLQNITGDRPVADEAALIALLDGLGMERVLASLGNGLQSPVGEGGRELSGGQRQLVALARAMLPRPRWLLLDEPVSAMDEDMQRRVASVLQALPADRGFVIATHRPELLACCQRVLVLEQGKLVLDQPREQFLAQQLANQQAAQAGRQRRVVIRAAEDSTKPMERGHGG